MADGEPICTRCFKELNVKLAVIVFTYTQCQVNLVLAKTARAFCLHVQETNALEPLIGDLYSGQRRKRNLLTTSRSLLRSISHNSTISKVKTKIAQQYNCR